MPASEAQKRATAKYIKENLQEIRFGVKLEQADQVKKRAQEKGLSVRAYLLDLIQQDMQDGK